MLLIIEIVCNHNQAMCKKGKNSAGQTAICLTIMGGGGGVRGMGGDGEGGVRGEREGGRGGGSRREDGEIGKWLALKGQIVHT